MGRTLTPKRPRIHVFKIKSNDSRKNKREMTLRNEKKTLKSEKQTLQKMRPQKKQDLKKQKVGSPGLYYMYLKII